MVTALSGNHSRTFYVTLVSSFTHPTCYLFKYLPLSWRPFLNFSPLLSVKDLSSYFAEKIKVLNGELTQFSSVQLLSHVWLFATPWTTAHQASLFITSSRSLLKPMSIELVMPSNYLILCRLPSSLPSLFPNIRVFSNQSALCIRPKYWSFSFNISPSNEHPGPISLRMDWLDLLQSKGLSRVFSNITVQKHQFFCVQPSL